MSIVLERRPQRQQRTRTFTITFRIDSLDYHVIPLAPDLEVATHAFRLKKAATGETYDVSCGVEGHFTCECKGFLRWGMCKDGKGCKHIRCLVAARMMPAPPLMVNGQE